MTRRVGSQERDEFIRDPVEAWRRGRVLDAMLASLPPVAPRGVRRARHEVFNSLDDALQLERARALNT